MRVMGGFAALIVLALFAGCGVSSLIPAASTSSPPPVTSFTKGGVVGDSFIRTTWGGSAFWPLQQFRDAGMELVRVGVTTLSCSDVLDPSNPSAWSAIPYQSDFWSCREVAGEILKEAGAMGYKLDAFLFLSDVAANAAQQNLPSAWSGLSISEIESKVQQSAADTANYFKNTLGLDISVYEIGNEIDFGMLGYFVGTGIAKPTFDWVNQSGWLEDNVWNIEAGFLKAAIQGIKSMDPAAKIGLHIAGLGYSYKNRVVTRFFKYMQDNGVDFDIAELSYPYMFGQAAVPQPYFEQAEFTQTLDALRVMGKEVYIAEFSYPAASNGITATPSGLYPYTDAGQNDFLKDFFAVVREHAEGAFYFYPDYYPGCSGTPPQDALESSGLFSSATSPRPGLSQFDAGSP